MARKKKKYRSIYRAGRKLITSVKGVSLSVKGVLKHEIKGSGKHIAREVRDITGKSKILRYKKSKYRRKRLKEAARDMGY